MASRFCDSFEHYTTSQQMTRKWTIASATTIAGGRNGRCAQLGPGSAITKTLTPELGWTCGWAYQQPSVAFGEGALYQSGTIAAGHGLAILVQVYCEIDGTITITAGANTVLGRSTQTLNLQVWEYIEVQTSYSGTTPINVTITVKVNGVQWLNATGSTGFNATDVITGSFTGANWHSFGATNQTSDQYIDDLYIVDSTGSVNNTFLGDVKIVYIVPASDTATVQWTPSAGSAHWSLLNEVPPDDDTTYINSNTTTQQDIWNWQQLTSFSGTIPFVQYLLCVRKDDEGTRSFQQIVSSILQTGNTFYPSDEYDYFIACYDKDPATTAAWTVTGFNSDSHGIEIIS